MLPFALQTHRPSWHEQQFRRQALMAIVGLSLATSIFGLTVGFPLGWTPGVKTGLALLIVKNVAFLLWLRTVPGHYALVGALHLLVLAVTGIYKFAQETVVEQMVNGLGTYSYWLPLTYVVAFLVFRSHVAIATSVGIFAALTMITLLYLLDGSALTGAQQAHSALLVQVLLMHLTLISFFVLFGVLQRGYIGALAEAQSEARAGYLDSLTGVPNRRQLTLWLSERTRSTGTSEALSIILFDLDRFKHINDTHGHDYGDEVLRRTTQAVGTSLRRGTLFGRWGGEEFLVILPGTATAEAQGVAERLRQAVAAMQYDRPIHMTVSLGVAQAQLGERPETLLKRADDALYAAKHAGRNQVHAA
ncbi:diguanylate cyclase [Deinococcus sp. QL22]|uniref:GGDEF domain-containing protein n=1 Tax=Deinococcus sp. QL22 TaxID=2939437 RepID=UPI00201725A7|nr:GGDEF domain-containing protein [Deinococcus sp. QL22]UQN08413.1 GGDEF domain-containing protein [Deinococcus sp. QL22]